MIIFWHHNDLRLEDNVALTYACDRGEKLLPLFIYDTKGEEPWPPGEASQWWLYQSLRSLANDYKEQKSALAFRKGNPLDILLKLSPKEVIWTERIEPSLRKRDASIVKKLKEKGIKATIIPQNTLIHPRDLLNKSEKPFRVFTPFYKALLKQAPHNKLLPAPSLPPLPKVAMGKITDLRILATHSCQSFWEPGRKGALKSLNAFKRGALRYYDTRRDIPSEKGTSKLSAPLHFGELSINEVWQKTDEPFRRQLAWREFSYYFLYHFPDSTNRSWRPEFEKFAWKKDAKALKMWQQGMTGYPIVDAGMRELLETGWMHNRVRMIVASFLIKDLHIHWIEGAKWFFDKLVDADLANNTMGWQWVAGSGPDAAPYFRIFNPTLQGKKFDPEGTYIRRFVKELQDVPTKHIHSPLEIQGYPPPMVDHAKEREAALLKYKKISLHR